MPATTGMTMPDHGHDAARSPKNCVGGQRRVGLLEQQLQMLPNRVEMCSTASSGVPSSGCASTLPA